MSRDLPNIGPTHFPPIPTGDWRKDAACAGHKDLTLWDASIPQPENNGAKEARLHRAAAICNTRCKVREQCAASVDWRFDEGVRGGHVLPLLTVTGGHSAPRDVELRRLLRAGVPLDEAAAAASRHGRKAS